MARIQSLGSMIRPRDLYGAVVPRAVSLKEQDEHLTISLGPCGGILLTHLQALFVYEVSKTDVYLYETNTMRIHDLKLSR